ncbi:hypothetical protein [Paenibacillus wulumuqiensis]|uniref:hypothetical protein n=1 Tax=Paenibacillus wulumuqiensis TaxID=1567107 RepID=UPI0006192E00|nr:hypothetical protein [Paenibacillus wulumuqiensis]
MLITKKGISFFIILTVLILLVACGDNGNKNVSNSKVSSSSADSGSQDEVTYSNEDSLFSDDGPQDGPPGGFTPLSEALKKHSVWLATTVIDESDLTRDTSIGKVYVFDNDEVTYYDYSEVAESLKIEDAAKMTDEDIVKHSQEFAKKSI